MSDSSTYSELIREAVRHFWSTRSEQANRDGAGDRDRGARSLVTGGRQLDGFVRVVVHLLTEAGIPEDSIKLQQAQTILPGFFRPTKKWDLVVVVNEKLIAVIEFKSQFGSLGNNANNRAEEAIGSAQDFWTAYREGAFKDSPRPWLGYVFLLEDSPKSRSPVKCAEPNFPVFQEFVNSSYVDRYSLLCKKLVRERIYDAAALLLSVPNADADGIFGEPEPEATFEKFAKSLLGHVLANS